MTAALAITRAGFIRHICEQPHDDAARLIFADWLHDHGEPERAEFIRLGFAIANTPETVPAYDLLNDRLQCLYEARHHTAVECRTPLEMMLTWSPMSRICADDISCRWGFFRNGFLYAVMLSCADWLAHGRDLVLAQPITSVRLTDLGIIREGAGRFLAYAPGGPDDVWEWEEAIPSIRKPTPEDARGAYCASALAWARNVAELPPLPALPTLITSTTPQRPGRDD